MGQRISKRDELLLLPRLEEGFSVSFFRTDKPLPLKVTDMF